MQEEQEYRNSFWPSFVLKFWRCTDVMSDKYGSYEYLQEEGPSFVKYTQLTQVPTRSASKIDGGVKHGLPCTGTFKELFRKSNYWQEF